MRKLKEVKKELDTTKEKIETYENHKEEWQSELSKSDDALELAKTELKNVNDQLEAAEKEKNELKDRLVKLGNRQDSIDDKMEELHDENEDLKNQLDEAKGNTTILEMNVSTLQGTTSELEYDLSVVKENLAIKDRRIHELDGLLASQDGREKVVSLERQIGDLEDNNKTLYVILSYNIYITQLKYV